jgi:hypothetical protein
MMHDFWAVTDPMMHQLQMVMFLKNPSLDQYAASRIDSGSLRATILLQDVGNGFEVPHEQISHPHVQALIEMTCTHNRGLGQALTLGTAGTSTGALAMAAMSTLPTDTHHLYSRTPRDRSRANPHLVNPLVAAVPHVAQDEMKPEAVVILARRVQRQLPSRRPRFRRLSASRQHVPRSRQHLRAICSTARIAALAHTLL